MRNSWTTTYILVCDKNEPVVRSMTSSSTNLFRLAENDTQKPTSTSKTSDSTMRGAYSIDTHQKWHASTTMYKAQVPLR